VRSSDVDRAERYGPGSITSTSQLAHNRRKPSLGPRGDVLDDEVRREDLVDDAEEVVEGEAASGLDPETLPESGGGHVLAGESSAENIDSWGMADGRDIVEPLYLGEVVSKHAGAERVDLALPGDACRNARLDERREHPELKPSDARVEASN
jgi:hypothetical protein